MRQVAHNGLVFDLYSREHCATLAELDFCRFHHWRGAVDVRIFLAFVQRVYRWPSAYATGGHVLYGGTCGCGSDISIEVNAESEAGQELHAIVLHSELVRAAREDAKRIEAVESIEPDPDSVHSVVGVGVDPD